MLVHKLTSPANSHWRRRPGQLIRNGAVPLSLDLTAIAQALSYRYRLVKRPQQLVESNPAICAGELQRSGALRDRAAGSAQQRYAAEGMARVPWLILANASPTCTARTTRWW